jgi:hypothetical protein
MIIDPVLYGSVVIASDRVHHKHCDAPGVEQFGVTATDLGKGARGAKSMGQERFEQSHVTSTRLCK